MDFETNKADLLAHYVKLAANPGWKAYVWARVNELADKHPQFYGDMPAKLTEAMKPAA